MYCAPNWPERIALAHRGQVCVTIMYTAPTAIPVHEWFGMPKKHDLSSLRLLGTRWRAINPEA